MPRELHLQGPTLSMPSPFLRKTEPILSLLSSTSVCTSPGAFLFCICKLFVFRPFPLSDLRVLPGAQMLSLPFYIPAFYHRHVISAPCKVIVQTYSVRQARKKQVMCKLFVDYKMLGTCEGPQSCHAALHPKFYSRLCHQNSFSCLPTSESWVHCNPSGA